MTSSLEAKKTELQKALEAQKIDMKEVQHAKAMIDKMTCRLWKEKCYVSSHDDIPNGKQEDFLHTLKRAHGLSKTDIDRIKCLLFGAGSKKVIKGIDLEWGKFFGKYAMIAAMKDSNNFSMFLAIYKLTLKEKPKRDDEEDAEYFRLHGCERDTLESYFRYRLLEEFMQEGLITSYIKYNDK